MKRIALLAAAAALAAPAVFAQTAATVVQGGGPVLLEGPAMSRPIAGAVIAQAPVVMADGTVAVVPSTTVLGGPAAVVTTTPMAPAAVTHYWNVPPDIGSRPEFQRWLRLWP